MTVMPIGRVVREMAERDPDRPAVTFEGETITRLELERRSNRLARAYRELGVRQHDFVTIALPNGIRYYEATLAIWKLGATPQPVSAKLPFLERDAIVELANPSLIIGVETGTHGERPCIPVDHEPGTELSDEPLEDDLVARHYKAMTSGGSTGRPKLIVSADPGEIDPNEMVLGIEPDRAHLVPGPLYHNGPFAFSLGALLRGNHLVVLPRFDALETLRLIERHQVDYVLLVPTMMHRIWRLAPEQRSQFDLSSLRVVLHLAAPCPEWLKQEWIDWLGPERIFELYGGTEAQGATWIDGIEWLSHRGSVGKPREGCRMKVLGDDGKELAPGEVGEIYILPDTGPGTTYHYLGANAKVREGWESLGDLGWLDEDGYLYLADRHTDMILSGGANIYPAEVESALDSHAAVRSSAVIGLPDDDLGQRVHAIVDAPGGVSEEDLLAHLATRLVRYKIPRSFEMTDETLRDDAGKLRRSALRSERLEGQVSRS